MPRTQGGLSRHGGSSSSHDVPDVTSCQDITGLN